MRFQIYYIKLINYLTSCIICRIQDALTKLQNAINSKRVEVFAPNEVWEVNITLCICFTKNVVLILFCSDIANNSL